MMCKSILLHTWLKVLNHCIRQCRYSSVIKTIQLNFSYYRVMIEYNKSNIEQYKFRTKCIGDLKVERVSGCVFSKTGQRYWVA